MPPADGGLDWRGRNQQKMEPGEKRTIKDNMNEKKKKKKDQYEHGEKVIVALNTSSKNLPQQSELWLAGVWGLMRQLGEGGGGGRG